MQLTLSGFYNLSQWFPKCDIWTNNINIPVNLECQFSGPHSRPLSVEPNHSVFSQVFGVIQMQRVCCCYCPVTKLCLTLSSFHGLQHARFPCPSLSPRVFSSSCPLSQKCHPTHFILCHPLLLLPSIFPSIRVFFSESTICIKWSKHWSFSISPSNE